MQAKQETETLPRNVLPVAYKIDLDIDPNDIVFYGSEQITLNIAEKTKRIVLNSAGLRIKNMQIFSGEKELFPWIEVDSEKETITFELDEEISGEAKLELEFKGSLGENNLQGLYISKYKDDSGLEQKIATTQFEAADARRAFPCFDQPDMKATYDISIVVPKGMLAISNMPVKDMEVFGDSALASFQQTPVMSSYLVYFGVGKFERLEDQLGDIQLRFISRPGKSEQGRFMLDMTKRFLDWHQKYAGILYPLPKLDSIAIPDFAYGAMENWGAITYRELLAFMDPAATTTETKKRQAMVAAHELGHKWSGNLVTMKWWDDLWLNESFATFMAYKAVDAEFPEWETWHDFVTNEAAAAMNADSLSTTHPIKVPVKSAKESAFDKISYGKGGSVLRMVEAYLGADNFRNGVRLYLERFKYQNATSEDLWASLAEATDPKIKDVMDSWIKQAGHPVIEAELEGTKLKLRQRRLGVGADSANTQTWKVPIVMQVEGAEKSLTHLLEDSAEEIELNGTPSFVKLNAGQTGVYRVKYSDNILSKLSDLIAEKKMPVMDRFGMQNDLFNLALCGEAPITKYLNLLNSFKNENELLALRNIYGNMKQINLIFSQNPQWDSVAQKFYEHAKAPFKKEFERLGWQPKEGERMQDSILRAVCLDYLASANDEEVLREGMQRYQKHISGEESLPADLRKSVYTIAAVSDGAKAQKQFIELFKKTDSSEERKNLLAALASFKDEALLKQSMDFFVSDSVKVQDWRFAFPALAANPYARNVLLSGVRDNWDIIKKQKDNGATFILSIIEPLTSLYFSNSERESIESLFKADKVGHEIAKNMAFENMRRNAAWFERDAEGTIKYFN